MLKIKIAVAIFTLSLSCAEVFAQTTPPSDQAPAGDQGPPPGAGDQAMPGAGKRAPAKQVVADCVAQAKAKGLKGPDRKAAVDECVAAQRPKLAARRACRQQGKAQGLADDALKDFVKNCVAQGPSPQ